MSGRDEEVREMGMDQEALRHDLSPIVEPLGLELHDVEIQKGLVRVTLNRAGGITLDELTSANHAISVFLDDHEPFQGRYTLEVTSPGVERKLRTPAHFAAAIGEKIRIKTVPDSDLERRIEGVVVRADDHEVVVDVDGNDVPVALDQIERARTVFEWGPAPKPSPSRGGGAKSRRAKTPPVPERIPS